MPSDSDDCCGQACAVSDSVPRLHQRLLSGSWDTHGLLRALRSGELTDDQFLRYQIYVNEMCAISLHEMSVADPHGRLAMVDQIVDFKHATLGNLLLPQFFLFCNGWTSMTQACVLPTVPSYLYLL